MIFFNWLFEAYCILKPITVVFYQCNLSAVSHFKKIVGFLYIENDHMGCLV